MIANSVERLIASWAQSSSVVSQGLGVGMAAGAAGVGAVREATQESDHEISCLREASTKRKVAFNVMCSFRSRA